MSSLSVVTQLWVSWTKIAIHHEALAREARSYLSAQLAKGNTPELNLELNPSMISINAAAFALDGIYGVAIKPNLAEGKPEQGTCGKQRRPKRGAKILEGFKQEFGLGKQANLWHDEFLWLFGIRGGAVHFEGSLGESSLHPLGLHTSPERATYRLESATRAVKLLIAVMGPCAACASPRTPATRMWIQNNRAALLDLIELWKSEGGEAGPVENSNHHSHN